MNENGVFTSQYGGIKSSRYSSFTVIFLKFNLATVRFIFAWFQTETTTFSEWPASRDSGIRKFCGELTMLSEQKTFEPAKNWNALDESILLELEPLLVSGGV